MQQLLHVTLGGIRAIGGLRQPRQVQQHGLVIGQRTEVGLGGGQRFLVEAAGLQGPHRIEEILAARRQRSGMLHGLQVEGGAAVIIAHAKTLLAQAHRFGIGHVGRAAIGQQAREGGAGGFAVTECQRILRQRQPLLCSERIGHQHIELFAQLRQQRRALGRTQRQGKDFLLADAVFQPGRRQACSRAAVHLQQGQLRTRLPELAEVDHLLDQLGAQCSVGRLGLEEDLDVLDRQLVGFAAGIGHFQPLLQ